jgi:4-hydroxythreonine-4-phosphate dehydrogenase
MSKSALGNKLPSIAITPGEPAGIGPDIVIQYAQQQRRFPWVVIADKFLLRERAQQLGLPLQFHEFVPGQSVAPLPRQQLHVWHTPLATSCQAGVLNPANAPYVLQCLRQAVHACQQSQFHALITGPVHKAVINEAGIAFSGHTEFLAELAGCRTVVMMLATPGLRVALVTTHLPLSQVCAQITAARLEAVLTILRQDLQSRFGLPQPRISVCGLNPHAGEAGHLGREEIEVIIPVLQRLRQRGHELRGPLPADTAFIPAIMQQTDAYLAMYHDQGLPVLKYVGFGKAVNITLGLPFVRTSVDHGTALELAGTGQADSGSLAYAIEVAQQMCNSANVQLHSA